MGLRPMNGDETLAGRGRAEAHNSRVSNPTRDSFPPYPEVLTCLARSLPEAGGLCNQVVPLRQAGSAEGRRLVMPNGSFIIARHLEQMGANRVESMMISQPSIGVQRIQQLESRGRAVHHGRRDRLIEHHHRIAGHAFQEVVECQDLRPVGILRADRFIMNGGDGSL
jgi:hypothetical protein